MAIIAGFVGLHHDEQTSTTAMVGIVAGFAEIVYKLAMWARAGVFA